MKPQSDIWDIVEEKSPAYSDLIDTTNTGCEIQQLQHLWQLVALENMQQPKLIITNASAIQFSSIRNRMMFSQPCPHNDATG